MFFLVIVILFFSFYGKIQFQEWKKILNRMILLLNFPAR